MSIAYNPRLIADGLVLHLDAVNSKSYKGTTTWFDLSGKNNNGTMFGTPTFSTDGGGCFDFSAVTSSSTPASIGASLGFTFASNMIPTTGSFTFSCWIKNPPDVGQVCLFSNAGGADGYRFGIRPASAYVLISGASGVGYSEPSLNFSSSLLSTLWYNVCMIFDRAGSINGTPQWQLYLNGVYQTATNMVATQPAFSSNLNPGLVRGGCCSLYTGKIATFSAHSRVLSAIEIQQNYNALRGRFGL